MSSGVIIIQLARIEEVKETPSAVILDEARSAVEKDQPKRKLIVIFAFFLGGFIGLGVTLIYHTLKKEIV